MQDRTRSVVRELRIPLLVLSFGALGGAALLAFAAYEHLALFVLLVIAGAGGASAIFGWRLLMRRLANSIGALSTAQEHTELHSRENERRLRLLLSQRPAIFWTVDAEGRLNSLTGADDGGLQAADLLASCAAEIRRALTGEAVTFELHQRGRSWRNEMEPLRDDDAKIIGAICVMVEVTDLHESADRLSNLVRQDPMTHLPNRVALEERLPELLEKAAANNESVAVLFVDIDRFKTINDTLGHRTGDELLRGVASRLSEQLANRASVFRSGGDEFVVVMDGIRHKRSVASIAMDVLTAFREPFSIGGRDLFVTASVGTSIFPQNAQTADELVTFADSAMYRAKESGRNNAKFYDGTMHAHVLERMGLEQDLRQALARGELALVYQPVVDLRTRRVVAAEALLRWEHPVLGELLPAAFIPIAEESGIIVEITRWVLRTACTRAAELRGIFPDFRIAVNFSARDFYEVDCATIVGSILADTGIPAAALDIEVTENVMLSDLAPGALRRIGAMGVRIVVDDFGTGYSSLGYIKRLPVDAIKIDKSFIADVTEDQYDRGIVKAITTLAQTLGLRVIAEGIETEAQREFVAGLRCDQAQGFLFYRPGSWEELARLFERDSEARPTGARVIQLHGGGARP